MRRFLFHEKTNPIAHRYPRYIRLEWWDILAATSFPEVGVKKTKITLVNINTSMEWFTACPAVYSCINISCHSFSKTTCRRLTLLTYWSLNCVTCSQSESEGFWGSSITSNYLKYSHRKGCGLGRSHAPISLILISLKGYCHFDSYSRLSTLTASHSTCRRFWPLSVLSPYCFPNSFPWRCCYGSCLLFPWLVNGIDDDHTVEQTEQSFVYQIVSVPLGATEKKWNVNNGVISPRCSRRY